MRNNSLFWALLLPCTLNAQADTLREYSHADDKLAPTKDLVLLKIVVQDLNQRKLPDLDVSVVQTAAGKTWQGVTGKYGEVNFRLPKGQTYRIGAGNEPAIETITLSNDPFATEFLRITHLPKAFTEEEVNDTIRQQVSLYQTPTRDRVLLIANILDLDDKPIEGEVLYFAVQGAPTVYTATTDARGKAALMLPNGRHYCFSTAFYKNLKCYELPDNGKAGQLKITYNTIGTRELLRRQAERARLAAVRDSLYQIRRARDSVATLNRELKESDFVDQLVYGAPLDSVIKKIEKRSAREREAVAKDPKYFEKTGEVVKATFFRMGERWAHKVVVTDLTGSMSPYMDQVVLWHALQLVQHEENRYLFFNDGDRTPEDQKRIGQTGGLYFLDRADMPQLLEKMRETTRNGNGGDSPENDLEALLAGAAKKQGMDELLLIADNYSDVRDKELVIRLNVPVHIVLCGAESGINEDYLEIAYKTKGSIHTIEQDIDDLAALAEGQTVAIGAFQYRVSRGTFIKVSKM
ncbi:MAG: hypothetical protein SFV52_11990 [Saprospiraceae bacterium]|nr:hypothetical protein [Saprospiraceae bacterium]